MKKRKEKKKKMNEESERRTTQPRLRGEKETSWQAARPQIGECSNRGWRYKTV